MITINYSDYICGERFAKLSDLQYRPGNKIPDDNLLVYCRSDDIEQCLSAISENKKNRYVLISHNGDRNVNQDIVNSRPGNIHHWFAQNANAIATGFEGLPIGISNPEWGELGSISQVENVANQKVNPSRWLYYGVNLETNISERTDMWKHIVSTFSSEQQFTHGTKIPRIGFLTECSNSKYIVSPPGNGIDCHRTWEALYLGRVPIVKRSHAMSYFRNLPILFYEKPQDITLAVLEANEHLVQRFYEHDLRRMFMSYWIDKILRKVRDIK